MSDAISTNLDEFQKTQTDPSVYPPFENPQNWRSSDVNNAPMSETKPKILYCRCAFAQTVPQATKDDVLDRLCESGESFEMVSDLCEMSARKDPRLQELLKEDEEIQIVACYHRAVKWLFHAADAPFPEDKVEVRNMKEESADEICQKILD